MPPQIQSDRPHLTILRWRKIWIRIVWSKYIVLAPTKSQFQLKQQNLKEKCSSSIGEASLTELRTQFWNILIFLYCNYRKEIVQTRNKGQYHNKKTFKYGMVPHLPSEQSQNINFSVKYFTSQNSKVWLITISSEANFQQNNALRWRQSLLFHAPRL